MAFCVYVQSLDMKALVVILETFDSQIPNVDARMEWWTEELKKSQPLITQLLSSTLQTNREDNRDLDLCRQVLMAL